MSNSEVISKLVNFISQSPDAMEYYWLAHEAFFEAVCDALDIDSNEHILDYLPPVITDQMYPVFLEFFFSNDYIDARVKKPWNVVDAFLASREGKKTSAEQKECLIALRDSYMSLYKVISVEKGTGFQAEELIEGKKQAIKISENRATHSIQTGDILGLRCKS